jgi:hypothetical protein
MQVAQFLHLPQILEDLVGLRLINAAERKADVHDDVIADLHLGHIGEADLSKDTSEIDFAGSQQRVVTADAGYFSWDGQTHCSQAYTRAGGGAMMGREEIRSGVRATAAALQRRLRMTTQEGGL